jgi:hypothetical protein
MKALNLPFLRDVRGCLCSVLFAVFLCGGCAPACGVRARRRTLLAWCASPPFIFGGRSVSAGDRTLALRRTPQPALYETARATQRNASGRKLGRRHAQQSSFRPVLSDTFCAGTAPDSHSRAGLPPVAIRQCPKKCSSDVIVLSRWSKDRALRLRSCSVLKCDFARGRRQSPLRLLSLQSKAN